ncbi:MAG: type IV pilin [Methanomassiliicoccales archaeon]|nr:type IV pilin [Methanomassiliicoccales archaeon]
MVGEPTRRLNHMMKKMWKKNNKAVSPVIATILMVAITVVLAAVLYVMVMGMSGGDTASSPTCTLQTDSNNNVVISISPATAFGTMSFKIADEDAVDFADGASCTYGTTNTITATFDDVGADDKVTTGDYFTITEAGTGASGTLIILWTSGDTVEQIASIAL